jgi:hypothetical protein
LIKTFIIRVLNVLRTLEEKKKSEANHCTSDLARFLCGSAASKWPRSRQSTSLCVGGQLVVALLVAPLALVFFVSVVGSVIDESVVPLALVASVLAVGPVVALFVTPLALVASVLTFGPARPPLWRRSRSCSS